VKLGSRRAWKWVGLWFAAQMVGGGVAGAVFGRDARFGQMNLDSVFSALLFLAIIAAAGVAAIVRNWRGARRAWR
jgi:hypothetical protein